MDFDKYQIFLNTTENSKNYIIKDVKPDGDCGFRSFALNLNLYNLNLIDLLNNKKYKQINSLNNNYKKNNTQEKWKEWNYNGKKLEEVSKTLRKITINYIITNWKNPINDELLNYEGYNTLGEFTLDFHEIKTKEIYYKEYLDNKEQNSWVSSPELYALSKLLGVTIRIYVLIRYFKNKNSTDIVKLYKNGKVPINTRLKLFQVIGSNYEDCKHKIDLLYELDKNGLNHYLFLKKKPL